MRREEREARFSVGQHQVHVALRDADRRAVPCNDHQGCGAAHASGLAYPQGSRQSLSPRRRGSTCASNCALQGLRRRVSSGSTKYRSRRGTSIGSSSVIPACAGTSLEAKRAIWFGGDGRSEKDMDQFYADLGKENAGKIRLAVMDIACPREGGGGSRFVNRRKAMRRKQLFCSTSSIFSGILARRSIKSARVSMRASRGRSGSSSRGRNTFCFRTGRICHRKANEASSSCSRPTNG